MKVRGFKRVAASVAAASALALGAGVLAPGVAMADEGDDPEVTAGEGLENPILDVEQDGYDVTVTITNPNGASWLVDGSACAPVLISGPGLVESGLMLMQNDYLGLAEKALAGGSDFKVGAPALTAVGGKSATATTKWENLDPNVYALAGICTDASTLLGDFDSVSFDVEPVIVPGGIGDLGSLEAVSGLAGIFG